VADRAQRSRWEVRLNEPEGAPKNLGTGVAVPSMQRIIVSPDAYSKSERLGPISLGTRLRVLYYMSVEAEICS
jgi:hypothetical protein